MDSNSNAVNMTLPKIEVDADIDTSSRRELPSWSSEGTLKLIELYEKDCKVLWDNKHLLYKDRSARQAKQEYLANIFGTTTEEITRKLHNLRTQFNNEVRKIKRKQAGGEVVKGSSGWEYFDALLFMLREQSTDFNDTIEGVNLALAEFQADEEVEFRTKAQKAIPSSPPKIKKPGQQRVAASAPPPLPPSAHPLMWPEEPQPRLRPAILTDECQIFGDFVASELRTLRSNESRKRLKRIIQKAILQIGEEEDVNIITI